MGAVQCCAAKIDDELIESTKVLASIYDEPELGTYIEEVKPETKDCSDLLGNSRTKEHIVTLVMKSGKLGLILTSDSEGKDAYVTKIDHEKNRNLKKSGVQLYSKLIKVNDQSVESKPITIISKLIIAARIAPLTLTFCKPTGLNLNEKPDTRLIKEVK